MSVAYNAEEVADAIRTATDFERDALEDLTNALGVLTEAQQRNALPDHQLESVTGELSFSLRFVADRIEELRDALTDDNPND